MLNVGITNSNFRNFPDRSFRRWSEEQIIAVDRKYFVPIHAQSVSKNKKNIPRSRRPSFIDLKFRLH